MRTSWILTAALVAALAPSSALASSAVCVANGNVSGDDRKAVIAAAHALADPILAGDGLAAFRTLSNEARSLTSEAELTALAGMLAVGRDKPVAVSGVYMLDAGDARPDDFVDCRDTAPADDWVAVRVFANGHRQAQVVLSIVTPNNDLALRVLLGWRDGAWRRDAVSFGVTTAAGRTGLELFALGKKQLEAGHELNAHLLLSTASQMIDRGAGMDLQASPALRDAMKSYEAPSGFDGAAYRWTLNGREHRVRSITLIALGGKIGIVMDHEISPWPGDDGADLADRQLTDAFMAAHPEWAESFAFVAAKALSPEALTPVGGPSFTTVYEVGKGY